ncbi:hypothetical protein KI387_009781, partial [Taxus chinensis]
EQELLKKRLVLKDDFPWKILPSLSINEEGARDSRLCYIGGVDLSFLKDHPSIACAAFVVVDLDTLCVVYEAFDVVHLTMPYIPGFLAFRECPAILGLLNKMMRDSHPFYPQLHHVDGLNHMEIKKHFAKNTNRDGDLMPLIGKSGRTWGA